MIGVFTVHRKMFDHALFDGEVYSRRDAWVWLIGNAVWKPTKVRMEGHTVTLDRGQLAYSLRFMARKWRWSKDRVARFLACLKTETMIATETRHGMSLITICNYNEYQFSSDTARDANEPPAATLPRHNRDKEEELNKERIDIVRSEATDESVIALSPKAKRSTGIDPSFIEFYSAYPRRQSKQDAIKAYSAVLKTGVTHETIMRGLEAAKRVDRRFRDPQFTPLPASWLRAGGFEDEAGSTPQQDWKRAVFS